MKHRAVPLRRLLAEQPEPEPDAFDFEATAAPEQDADDYQRDEIAAHTGPFIPESY